MPDPATPATAPATEKPAAPAVSTDKPTPAPAAAPAPAPASPPETTAPSAAPDVATPATPAPDWRETLKSVDVKELLKDERIAGHVGDLTERRARKLVADELAKRDADAQTRAAQERATAEQARRDDLRDKDAWAYVQEEKQREAVARQQAEVWNNVDALLHQRFYDLPPTEQEKLANKTYAGATPVESRQAFLRDLGAAERRVGQTEAQAAADQALTERLATERAKWEADELPAKVKESLSATNGREPSPDNGTGGVPADGLINRAEWAQHEKDYGWIRANRDRVNKSLAVGSIFK